MAEERAPQADRDHGDHVIEAEDRMGEAAQEATHDPCLRMGQGDLR